MARSANGMVLVSLPTLSSESPRVGPHFVMSQSKSSGREWIQRKPRGVKCTYPVLFSKTRQLGNHSSSCGEEEVQVVRGLFLEYSWNAAPLLGVKQKLTDETWEQGAGFTLTVPSPASPAGLILSYPAPLLYRTTHPPTLSSMSPSYGIFHDPHSHPQIGFILAISAFRLKR